MKPEQKTRAVQLRSQGLSIGEISSQINVAKSTVYVWTKAVALNKRAKKRLWLRGETGRAKAVETNKQKRLALVKSLVARAHGTLLKISVDRNTARLLCALLHWCEGNKDEGSVGFTNSDPVMIRAFMELFRRGFDLDESKLRVCLHLHEYHNEKKQKIYWARVLRLPLTQFMKVYLKPHTGKNKRAGYPGCISIRYYDSKVAIELCALWKLFGQKFI